MQLVFIIFGAIIVISFITGIILTFKEKKKKATETLTDDPRILFSVDEDKAIIAKAMQNTDNIASNEVVEVTSSSEPSKEEKGDTVVEEISDSEGFDLPTNHDYNSHKYVVHPVPTVPENKNVVASNNNDVPVTTERENKQEEARFISYNFDSVEDII